MTVWCEDCDCIHPDTRKEPPWRQRCMKAPVEPTGYGFVSRAYSPTPPYALCRDKNPNGECEDFVARRVAPEKPKVAA